MYIYIYICTHEYSLYMYTWAVLFLAGDRTHDDQWALLIRHTRAHIRARLLMRQAVRTIL